MATPLDPAATEARARQLLDSRIASVRALVTARQQIVDLRAKLDDAEREDVRLYAGALRDGWTCDELRQLGIGEPAKKERVRRRANGKPKSPAPEPVAE